jgi:hypothetical protein
MVFVNHAQKFKRVAKRMWYVKADCCHLNRNAKALSVILMILSVSTLDDVSDRWMHEYGVLVK